MKGPILSLVLGKSLDVAADFSVYSGDFSYDGFVYAVYRRDQRVA